MTSKEALENIKDKAQLLALFMGKDAGEHLVLIDTLYNIIKKDLERLETLKKGKKEIEKSIIHTQFAGSWLLQENEKLKTRLKEIETNYNYIWLGKLETAIKILNDKMPIQFLGYNKYGAKPYEIISNGFVIGLDQQEYELLKEVLGE